MDSDDSYHSESEFYYPDEFEDGKNKENTPVSELQKEQDDFTLLKNNKKKIKILFAGLGRSVLRKTVPSVLSTARGLRPRAVLKTSGTVFLNTDLPAGK